MERHVFGAKKLKIAFFLEGNLTAGGGLTQQLSVLDLIRTFADESYTYVVVVTDRELVPEAEKFGFEIILAKTSLLAKVRRMLSRTRAAFRADNYWPFSYFFKSPMDHLLTANNIDLVFFPGPSGIAIELVKHNYVFSVWDLCHLEHPEFPEVSHNRAFEIREELFSRACKKAVAVIGDSIHMKKLLEAKYRLSPDRVFALPFPPPTFHPVGESAVPNGDDVSEKFEIDSPYIFYPAQFWPHKNHIYILDALHILHRQHNWKLAAVFCGSDKGTSDHVLGYANKLDIKPFVKILGFVDRADLPALYRNAVAMVMPTYFGPTNLPPLEAFANDCPVCYSDHEAFRAQTKGAASYMNLDDPNSLVQCLLDLRDNPKLREQHILAGKELLQQWTAEDYWRGLHSIFVEFEYKRRRWS